MTTGARKAIMIHTGVVAALCVMALPLWVLGVPGTENSYARGWRIGLYTIMLYPLVWALASPTVARLFGGSRPSPDRDGTSAAAAWIRLCACLCALLALVLSFMVMT